MNPSLGYLPYSTRNPITGLALRILSTCQVGHTFVTPISQCCTSPAEQYSHSTHRGLYATHHTLLRVMKVFLVGMSCLFALAAGLVVDDQPLNGEKSLPSKFATVITPELGYTPKM